MGAFLPCHVCCSTLQPVSQVYLSEVALYTDYKLDESYTPTKLSIRVGNNFADLREASLGGRG